MKSKPLMGVAIVTLSLQVARPGSRQKQQQVHVTTMTFSHCPSLNSWRFLSFHSVITALISNFIHGLTKILSFHLCSKILGEGGVITTGTACRSHLMNTCYAHNPALPYCSFWCLQFVSLMKF